MKKKSAIIAMACMIALSGCGSKKVSEESVPPSAISSLAENTESTTHKDSIKEYMAYLNDTVVPIVENTEGTNATCSVKFLKKFNAVLILASFDGLGSVAEAANDGDAEALSFWRELRTSVTDRCDELYKDMVKNCGDEYNLGVTVYDQSNDYGDGALLITLDGQITDDVVKKG